MVLEYIPMLAESLVAAAGLVRLVVTDVAVLSVVGAVAVAARVTAVARVRPICFGGGYGCIWHCRRRSGSCPCPWSWS